MATYVWKALPGFGQESLTDAANWSGPGGVPGAHDATRFVATGRDETITGTATLGAMAFTGSSAVFAGATLAVSGLGGGPALLFEARSPRTYGQADFTDFSRVAAGAVVVGEHARGTLGIQDSSLTATGITLGAQAGASGTVSVVRSTLADTGRMVVGGHGGGSLYASGSAITIGNAATGAGGALDIGVAAGAAGNVQLGQTSLDVLGAIRLGGAASGGHGTATLNAQESTVTARSIVVGAGGTLVADTRAMVQAGLIDLTAGGQIDGTGTVRAHRIVNDGRIAVSHLGGYGSASTLRLQGLVVNDGVMAIGRDERLLLEGPQTGDGRIIFNPGGHATLQIRLDAVASTLVHFARTDQIRVPGLTGVAYDPATGRLTLLDGGTAIGTLTLQGHFSAGQFHVTPLGGLGVITLGPPPPPTFAFRAESGAGPDEVLGQAANWSPAGPPRGGDLALFVGGGIGRAVTGTLDTGRAVFAQGWTSFQNATITLHGVGTAPSLTIDRGARVAAVPQSGTIEQSSTITATTVAIGGRGAGQLLLGHDVLNTVAVALGGPHGTTGVLSLTAGTQWTNGGDVAIAAQGGRGSLSAVDSTVFINGTLKMGASPAPFYEVQAHLHLGDGTTMTVAASTLLGNGGAAEMSIRDSSFTTPDLVMDQYATINMVHGALHAGAISMVAGSVIAASGTIDTTAHMFGGGTIEAAGRLRIDGAPIQSGLGGGAQMSIDIESGAFLQLSADVLGSPTLTFEAGAGEALRLRADPVLGGSIAQFAAGDTIEVPDVTAALFDPATGHLALQAGTQAVATLDLVGSYQPGLFAVTQAGTLGLITYGGHA